MTKLDACTASEHNWRTFEQRNVSGQRCVHCGSFVVLAAPTPRTGRISIYHGRYAGVSIEFSDDEPNFVTTERLLDAMRRHDRKAGR